MYKPTPHFIGFLLGAFLLLVGLSAFADDTLTWQHPIEYTDSTPLNQADIAVTIVRYGAGTTANPPTVISAVNVPAPATSVVVTRDPLVAGTVCYQAATLMKPVPPATIGQQSVYAPSAWVCKTQTAPTPKKPRPPRTLTVS